MKEPFGILIVSTGHFSRAILDYVNHLLGRSAHVSATELKEEDHWEEALEQVEEAVAAFEGYRGVLILVEIMGGTPYNISKEIKKKHRVEVIGGINLPMVIKAVQVAEKMELEEASRYLESYGRDHILRCEKV